MQDGIIKWIKDNWTGTTWQLTYISGFCFRINIQRGRVSVWPLGLGSGGGVFFLFKACEPAIFSWSVITYTFKNYLEKQQIQDSYFLSMSL